jgi:hypothetical protein
VYTYRYTRRVDDTPCTGCPHCGHDWTDNEGILIHVASSRAMEDLPARLDDGIMVVVRTPDGRILQARDSHVMPYCAACKTPLIEMHAVLEDLQEQDA